MIGPCPHCGDTKNGFVVLAQARGPVEVFYDQDGNFAESSWDKTYTVDRGVTRCGACGKQRRDLRFDGSGNIVPVKSAPQLRR